MKRALKFLIMLSFMLSGVLPVFAGGGAEAPEFAEADEITVFLAASTTDVMDDLAALFREKTGTTVNLNPASSGTLARQLEQGAGADVYISASKKWMDYVNDLGTVLESSPFVRNRVVVVGPADTSLAPFEIDGATDLPGLFEGRLSMGDPEHVPAGKYAQEALAHFGWYDRLSDRILPAADVRAALAVVELGETELGIVYETDAMKAGGSVVILSRFPEESHTPVEYFCARLTPEGSDFYAFLLSEEAAAVFASYGFTPAD